MSDIKQLRKQIETVFPKGPFRGVGYPATKAIKDGEYTREQEIDELEKIAQSHADREAKKAYEIGKIEGYAELRREVSKYQSQLLFNRKEQS